MAELENILETGIVGVAIILVGMIKIPPVKNNFWQWLLRTMGKAINDEIKEEIDALAEKIKDVDKKVDDMSKIEELERVRQARQRILRFSDEILHAQRHSKEHFDEILEDVDLYEDYCREHEDYENNKAILAIATIRDIYKKCLKEHDFLVYKKQ